MRILSLFVQASTLNYSFSFSLPTHSSINRIYHKPLRLNLSSIVYDNSMPRGIKKENLPSKICVTCNRPFTWRKKWEKVWDEVSTCSKSCNRQRRQKNATARQMLMKAAAVDKEVNPDESPAVKRDEMEEENRNNIMHIEQEIGAEEKISETKQDIGVKEEVNLEENGDDALANLLQSLDVSPDDQSSLDKDQISQTSSEENDVNNLDVIDPSALKKAQRKAEKKRKKQERRAKREGRSDKSVGQKQCDMCEKSVDLLIRCTYDESLQWKMVCGKCWEVASGGVVDGDSKHPYYKYGGLWKNRKRK